MNMVWHYDERMHVDFSAILKETMIEHQGSGFFREHEFLVSAEAHEVGSTVLLDVGKISSIKSAHKKIVDRSRPRLRKTFGTQARAPALHN
jgi:hypothetical protein